MKKTIVALAFACAIAGLQVNSAAADVIDECPWTGSQAWKCAAVRDYAAPTPGWSFSDIWSVVYRTYFMW